MKFTLQKSFNILIPKRKKSFGRTNFQIFQVSGWTFERKSKINFVCLSPWEGRLDPQYVHLKRRISWFICSPFVFSTHCGIPIPDLGMFKYNSASAKRGLFRATFAFQELEMSFSDWSCPWLLQMISKLFYKAKVCILRSPIALVLASFLNILVDMPLGLWEIWAHF